MKRLRLNLCLIVLFISSCDNSVNVSTTSLRRDTIVVSQDTSNSIELISEDSISNWFQYGKFESLSRHVLDSTNLFVLTNYTQSRNVLRGLNIKENSELFSITLADAHDFVLDRLHKKIIVHQKPNNLIIYNYKGQKTEVISTEVSIIDFVMLEDSFLLYGFNKHSSKSVPSLFRLFLPDSTVQLESTGEQWQHDGMLRTTNSFLKTRNTIILNPPGSPSLYWIDNTTGKFMNALILDINSEYMGIVDPHLTTLQEGFSTNILGNDQIQIISLIRNGNSQNLSIQRISDRIVANPIDLNKKLFSYENQLVTIEQSEMNKTLARLHFYKF